MVCLSNQTSAGSVLSQCDNHATLNGTKGTPVTPTKRGPEMKTITLTDDEFDQLLVVCGYAAGAAMKDRDDRLAYSFIRLANRINEGNPKWTPYEVQA